MLDVGDVINLKDISGANLDKLNLSDEDLEKDFVVTEIVEPVSFNNIARQVVCKQIDKPSGDDYHRIVRFIEVANTSAVITNIVPVGKAKQIWEMK